jgi:hypothetical protein
MTTTYFSHYREFVPFLQSPETARFAQIRPNYLHNS